MGAWELVIMELDDEVITVLFSRTVFQMLISHWCFRRWCTKPACLHKFCMLTTLPGTQTQDVAIILPQGGLCLKEEVERGTGHSETEKYSAEAWSQEIGKSGKTALATSTNPLDQNVWWKTLEYLNFYIKHMEMFLLKKMCLYILFVFIQEVFINSFI